jgi:hypothetical protein
MAANQIVPALLGIEHGRPQLAAAGDPGGLERLLRHSRLDVAECFQAHGVGQALGRIHGEDQNPAPLFDGGHGRGGRRRGRLPDPARTAKNENLLGRHQRIQ